MAIRAPDGANNEGRTMAGVRSRPPFGNARISKAPCQTIPSICSVFECSYSVSKMHLTKFVFDMKLMSTLNVTNKTNHE